MSEIHKKWEAIHHRLRELERFDEAEETGLLGEAYELLMSAYQEARELNDELEELLKNAFTN